MATPGSSSRLMRLVNIWRLLALRSDVDDIVLELLGRFSLEKIYSEADQKLYQRLVSTLLVQLDAVFYVQRLSLPPENQQSTSYLGFIVSWEVAVRCVEFVLQIIVESREVLWEAEPLRDKHLGGFLLNALRVSTLHPKTLGTQRVKDRRDRFARIHSSLERLYDNYPGPKSFLISLCREVTHALRTEPSALALPSKLRYELPGLASELYPLPECLSSSYVSTIVSQNNVPVLWLPSCLALRDVAHFVVAASIQYTIKGETRDVCLQQSSARTRNAVLSSLDNLNMPPQLSRVELTKMFGDIFQIILPDTPSLATEEARVYLGDEYEVDAMDDFCRSLSNRQMLHRVSDRQMMRGIADVTRSISLLDDPSGQHKSISPRIYVLNCRACHFAGDTQLNYAENLEFPDPGKGPEIKLPSNTKCVECGERVTLAREFSLARKTWALLKPLQPNTESISAERHLPDQFQLTPPKIEPGMTMHSSYIDCYSQAATLPPEEVGLRLRTTLPGNTPFQTATLPDRFRMSPRTVSDQSLAQSSPRSDVLNAERVVSIDGITQIEQQRKADSKGVLGSPTLTSPLSVRSPVRSDTRPTSPPGWQGARSVSLNFGKKESKKEGKSKWGLRRFGLARKDSVLQSADTSSISSSTLDQQKLEEIPLDGLVNASKSQGRGKVGINVYLAPNSTRALFWTPNLIQIWDVGTSPPTFTRAISPENTCLLAAVTKSFLAYITGPRDQKLTLRIINLTQADARVAEYHMPSSLWCRRMAMNPHETYVVVGFDNSTVRFFQIENIAESREQSLHSQHACKGCPAVETLSFSHDGLVLTASTRSPRTGLVQVYVWKYPFVELSEIPASRYNIPLHESEDNGISSAIFRPKSGGGENLICITSWTQSGAPILVQPEQGCKVYVGAESQGHQRRLGNRILSAQFSPSGRQLIMVNDKGNLYQISNLNSSFMDAKKLATSKEFTAKSDSFAMAYMSIHDEDSIVLAWAEPKGAGFVKKIPVSDSGDVNYSTTADIAHVPHPELPGDTRLPTVNPTELQSSADYRYATKDSQRAQSAKPGDQKRPQKAPVELAATDFNRRA